MSNTKRLYRQPQGKMIGGVCTGLGEYFEMDYTIIRLIWVISFLFAGVGVLAYLIAWIVIPEKFNGQIN